MRHPRLSSIEGQYKTFERSVPHISVLLRSLRSFQPVVPGSHRLKTRSMTGAQSPGRRPLTIVVAAVLLALEGLVGLGYAGIAVGQIRMSRAVVGSWRGDPDGRFRSLTPCGGTRGFPGQALEQRTGGCCPTDLASDRVELPRRRDHVGIGDSCGVGDRRAGRVAAPALDSRFRRAALQIARSDRRLTTTVDRYSGISSSVWINSSSCAASASACCLTRRRKDLVRSSLGFSSTSFGAPSSTTTP